MKRRWGLFSPALVLVGAALTVALCVVLHPLVLLVPLAVSVALLTRWWSDNDLAVSALQARPAKSSDEEVIRQIVRRLASRAGIPVPRVYIIDAEYLNAFATRTRAGGLVAVTTGAVNALSDDELEAVLAHEVGHLVNRDTFWGRLTEAVVMTLLILAVASGFALMLAISIVGTLLSRDDQRSLSFTAAIAHGALAAFVAVGAFIGAIASGAASRRRELLADRVGAELTSPQALASALEALDHATMATPKTPAIVAVAPQLFVDPFRSSWWSSLFATHPKTQTRVKKLAVGLDPGEAEVFRRDREGAAKRHAAQRAWAEWTEAWNNATERRAFLTSLTPRYAGSDEGVLFAPRNAELIYATTVAALVEVRQRQGRTHIQVTQQGLAAVTTRGLVFAGSRRVRWDFADVVAEEWEVENGEVAVIMQSVRRQKPSGLVFLDSSLPVRSLVRTARGDRSGGLRVDVAEVEAELRRLAGTKPAMPQ